MFTIILYLTKIKDSFISIRELHNQKTSTMEEYHCESLKDISNMCSPKRNTITQLENIVKSSTNSGNISKRSLPNSQIVNSCTSSPDVELLHKRLFSKGVTPLSFDITLLNNSGYFSEESDESFIRMENFLKGSNKNAGTKINTDKSTNETKNNPQIPKDGDLESIDKNENVSSDIDNESFVDDDKLIVEINNDQHTSGDDLESTSGISFNETLTFNDTLEEMEYYLKYGPTLIKAAQKLDEEKKSISNKSPKTNSTQDVIFNNECFKNEDCVTSADKESFNNVKEEVVNFNIDRNAQTPKNINKKVKEEIILKKEDNSNTKTPKNNLHKKVLNSDVKKRNVNITPVLQSPKPKLKNYLQPPKQDLKVKPTYIHKTTPFKVPIQEKSTPRTADRQLKTNHPIKKYENVMSPIAFYIKNSPSVPMVKNASPMKNYWDRVAPGPILTNANHLKQNIGKENTQLPEKAYKSPKITKIVQQTSSTRLPNNKQVLNMANNLPKPIVLKHVKREKIGEAFDSNSRKSNQSDVPSIEDSFSHLSVKSMDVSHCIGKMAARSKTLNKPKF